MSGHLLLPELADILAAHQGGQARSLQKRIGPSEIGEPCDRALAFRVAEIPPVNDDPLKWAPLVGTWGHAGLAEALAEDNVRAMMAGRPARWLIEQRVEVSRQLGIAGVTDAYDCELAEVVDWKFVGKTRLQTYRRKGPGETYRRQAHLYGRGWALMGLPVRTVRIVFLPRWSHLLTDGWEWSEPYDEDLAVDALDRLVRITRMVDQLGVREDPAQLAMFAGRPEETCRYCKWYREWPGPTGPADATGCPGAPKE